MYVLTLDVENTMYKHQVRNEHGVYNTKDRVGSAFCEPQWLVMTGLKWLGKSPVCLHHGDDDIFNDTQIIQNYINDADLIVGYNIKHDIHWIRRVGVDVSKIKQVWDCQLAEWMLNNQKLLGQNSLNDACKRHNLPLKLDVIEEEYWSKGIDTDEIPLEILRKYLHGDLSVTEQLYLIQRKLFNG